LTPKQRGPLFGSTYSSEIIGYLLKALDPKNDVAEIAQLQKDKDMLVNMESRRAISPILVPLEKKRFA